MTPTLMQSVSSLNAQRGPRRTQSAMSGVTPGTVPTSPAFGGMKGNTTAQTQTVDPYGRMTTIGQGGSNPSFGADGMFHSATSGFGPITIESPPGSSPAPDFGLDPARYSAPRAGGPPAAAPPIGAIPWGEFEPKAIPREAPMPGMPREVGRSPADRTAADAAVYGRAADKIGQIGAGNLRSLRSQMTRRGISGTGIEGENVAAVKNNTAGQLGDVVRDQAIEELRRQNEVDDRDFSGALTQRGQDLGVNSTNYGGNLTQRGQDISQADWKIQALPSILALMRARAGTGSL